MAFGVGGGATAPGRGDVSGAWGAPGCICGGIKPGCGGMPGYWLTTGLGGGGGGIATLIGSSLSSMACGGRWKVGIGAMLAAVAAGARLVGMIVTRS